MCGVLLTEKEEINEFRDWNDSDHATYEAVILRCIENGVMPDIDSREPWFTSASHTNEDAAITLGVFEEALKEVVG
jgi:glutamate-1-semialdehyde aminotransferase